MSYDISNDILVLGIVVKPVDRLRVDLSGTWTQSDAAIDPFDLSAPDYVATHPPTAYDFSQSHLYSDLDVTRYDAQLAATYDLADRYWLSLQYRYAELEDDAPYLYDTSGSFQRYGAAFGLRF